MCSRLFKVWAACDCVIPTLLLNALLHRLTLILQPPVKTLICPRSPAVHRTEMQIIQGRMDPDVKRILLCRFIMMRGTTEDKEGRERKKLMVRWLDDDDCCDCTVYTVVAYHCEEFSEKKLAELYPPPSAEKLHELFSQQRNFHPPKTQFFGQFYFCIMVTQALFVTVIRIIIMSSCHHEHEHANR